MGTLYLCATPIGNLEDITLRVLRTLKEVDLIAAEDTRQTIKLLNHFDIKTPLTSYHEHNKFQKTGLPGASAVITALTLGGLPTRQFAFEGFLPMDKKERVRALERLKNTTYTTVFYEAPHRLVKTLQAVAEVLPGTRKIAVCKELTKRHEKVMQCTLEEACSYYEKNEPKGEFVFVVEGADIEELESREQQKWEQVPIEEHMQNYLAQGMERKEAMKAVAKDRGMTKNQVYKELMR